MSSVYALTEKNIDSVARLVACSLVDCGVFVIPTDTIYGIVALEQCSEAIQRIFEIKKRPAQKQFIRLISGLDRVREYTDQVIPSKLLQYWPGPLTIVVRSLGGGTIALRFPNDPFLKSLFGYLDNRSIVAPSANISGKDSIFNCKELVKIFGGLVDGIACRDKPAWANSSVSKPLASTIVDISNPRIRVIREGAVKIKL